MKLSFKKLGIYCSLLVLGGGVGFSVSRHLKTPPKVLKIPQVYSEKISTIAPPQLQNNSSKNVNFIAQAVEKVGPAVVRIDASRELTSSLPEKFTQPFFRRFFGESNSSFPDKIERGTGSGFILSSDGRLMTNAHVVEGSKIVKVTLKDGQIYEGQVIGIDPITDVAVLKIEATNLPIVTIGDAETLTPGEWAIAIGNPLGLDNTVTVGIISAIDRSSSQVGVPDKRVRFIQTDAAINPGNSGGPLLNSQGEVIGINTAIRADAQGLGFAIPIETAQRIANQLFAKGKADHPYLGIHMVNLSPETKETINRQKELNFKITEERGVLIVKVIPNSPAAKAGLKQGDTIIKVEGKAVDNSLQVQEQVEISEIGKALKLEVVRDGKTKIIAVKPSIFPENK
jgi:S1-C subfamily serine protease